MKFGFAEITIKKRQSSPSRGTWIEIAMYLKKLFQPWKSSPSRGTWIEIEKYNVPVEWILVVPLTGDVD